MNQIERITEMEKTMDEVTAIVAEMKTALEKFRKVQERLHRVEKYYGSSVWFEDADADRHGRLPENLKCEVLANESVWKLLIENRELAIQMLETGTDIIKNK